MKVWVLRRHVCWKWNSAFGLVKKRPWIWKRWYNTLRMVILFVDFYEFAKTYIYIYINIKLTCCLSVYSLFTFEGSEDSTVYSKNVAYSYVQLMEQNDAAIYQAISWNYPRPTSNSHHHYWLFNSMFGSFGTGILGVYPRYEFPVEFLPGWRKSLKSNGFHQFLELTCQRAETEELKPPHICR